LLKEIFKHLNFTSNNDDMAEKFTDLLGQEYKAEVLKFLKDNPDDFFSINEIAEKTSGSNPSVKKFLEELSDIGLVKFRKKAGSYLVEYDRSSRYDNAVEVMLGVEIRDMRRQAERFAYDLFNHTDEEFQNKLFSVVLYGSVARGTANSNSDIDVLILANNTEDKDTVMDKALEVAKKRSNSENEIVPMVETTEEFHENWHSSTRFESNVEREGKILEGKNWEEIL
jgi:predicted nucleotidyltransferase/biotin operon repressor